MRSRRWPVRIWVDAGACPLVIKEILFRAAERTRVMTTLVANQLDCFLTRQAIRP